ncbi:MAG: hypothetical protein ACOY9Y_10115, partial [Bacillota bacterium]
STGSRHQLQFDLASPAAKGISSQEDPFSFSDGAAAGGVGVYSGVRRQNERTGENILGEE